MKKLLLLALISVSTLTACAQSEPQVKRTEDVLYGRKFGTALTLDVFEPAKKNSCAVLSMVCGGFFSRHEAINARAYAPFLDRGYTVCAIVHGSQPKFQIPEIMQDIHRAVRFVRHNAAKWGVDPNEFGITGASADGQSLCGRRLCLVSCAAEKIIQKTTSGPGSPVKRAAPDRYAQLPKWQSCGHGRNAKRTHSWRY